MRTRSRSAPVTRARVSTACMRGARPMKFSNMRSTSARIWKFSPILSGVIFMPSSLRLRAESGMPPGSIAPVSGWCASAHVQAISSPSLKTGIIAIWSQLWMPP